MEFINQMVGWINGFVVSAAICIPLLASLILLKLPPNFVGSFSIFFALVEVASIAHLWFYMDGDLTAIQFFNAREWLPFVESKYLVGIDGLGLMHAAVLVSVCLLLTIHLFRSVGDTLRSWVVPLFLVEGFALGSVFSFDIILTLFFLELMVVSLSWWVFMEDKEAFVNFVILNMVVSAVALIGGIYLIWVAKQQLGVYTASLLDLYQLHLSAGAQSIFFLGGSIFVGFKVFLWPMHIVSRALFQIRNEFISYAIPTILGIVFSFFYLRFIIPFCPQGVSEFGSAALAVGAFGILYYLVFYLTALHRGEEYRTLAVGASSVWFVLWVAFFTGANESYIWIAQFVLLGASLLGALRLGFLNERGGGQSGSTWVPKTISIALLVGMGWLSSYGNVIFPKSYSAMEHIRSNWDRYSISSAKENPREG